MVSNQSAKFRASHVWQNRFFADVFFLLFFFFDLHYAYLKIQNNLKRKTGPNECISQRTCSKGASLLNDFTLWDTANWYSRCGQKSYSVIFISFQSVKIISVQKISSDTLFLHQNTFFLFQNILHLFLFSKKNLLCLRTRGVDPPPVYGPVRNFFFFGL